MNDVLFENEIALVLIVKNESRYIKEWLEYHYRIGVDKFYIYDNDSEDRSDLEKILAPWIQAGVVDLETIPGVRRQMPAYNNAVENHRFDCRYMGFIDTDEFIFVKNGQTLLDLLNSHFNRSIETGGLSINWRMFGTSGRRYYEPIDVIERFTFRAPDNYEENFQIKTIANPRRISFMQSPHHASYTLGSGCCNWSKELVSKYYDPDNDCSAIQVNHYFTKSLEEYQEKVSRGRADIGEFRDDDEPARKDMNDVEDVGLKNLWRRLKTQPLPQPKDHSPLKILENVRIMLEPFLTPNPEIPENQIEKFVTCFFLIQKSPLLEESDKRDFEKIILNLIDRALREKKYDAYEIVLLVSVHSELLETRLDVAIKIVRFLFDQLPRLIYLAEDILMHAQRAYLRQVQKDLALILF